MDINPNTGKRWTDTEEATFAEIMRIGRMERIKAIQLIRRCKSDHAKAVKLARLLDWLGRVRNSRRIGELNC
jgi:hypothetical protein